MKRQVYSTRTFISKIFVFSVLITGILGINRNFLWAQTSFARGEELFLQNKPSEALRYLETAISEDPAHVQAFIYLGIAYIQTEKIDEAISIYSRIMPRAGSDTAKVAFNLGNAYFMKGNNALALQSYNQAIAANSSYSAAYLNRANTRVKNDDLSGSLEDYEKYLSLEPGSPQREQILRLMAFIREEFAAVERRRLLAEEAARAEAERRRRLLQEVTESLQAAAEASRGLSAGTEDVLDYDSEFEME